MRHLRPKITNSPYFCKKKFGKCCLETFAVYTVSKNWLSQIHILYMIVNITMKLKSKILLATHTKASSVK